MTVKSVLFPSDHSLFITDKSWFRPKGGSKKGQSSFPINPRAEGDGLSIVLVETSIKPRQTIRAETSANRGFRFVNATKHSLGGKDQQDVRRMIRSHVMKGIKKSAASNPIQTVLSKHDEQSEGADTNTPSPTPNTKTSTSQHGQTLQPIHDDFKPSPSPIPTCLITNSTLAFYFGLPFAIDPSYQCFIDPYPLTAAPILFPLQELFSCNRITRLWLPLAMTDELFLYAIMYTAAFCLSLADTRINMARFDRLIGRIYRQLATRIADGTTIDDATLGVVACLAMTENQMGNHDKWKVHMQGLQQMIQTRQDWTKINPEVLWRVHRSDLESSVDYLEKPVLLLRRERRSTTLFDSLPLGSSWNTSSVWMEFLDQQDMRPHTKDVFCVVANFATAVQFYTSIGRYLVPGLNRQSFDEDLLSIDQSLLELSDLNAVEESLQVACLIFSKSVARDLPLAITTSDLLPRRLRQAYTRALKQKAKVFPDEMMVWVFFMGAISSASIPAERAWFVDGIARLQLARKETRALLRGLLFVDAVHDRPAQRLFAEIEALLKS